MVRRLVGLYLKAYLVRLAHPYPHGDGIDEIGISKRGESSRLAVETTLHPISYTVFEGETHRRYILIADD